MIKISTLKNGIRVVTESLLRVDTVSLGVWVGVGSRYEKREENGILTFWNTWRSKERRRVQHWTLR